jgi:hypothetical protein
LSIGIKKVGMDGNILPVQGLKSYLNLKSLSSTINSGRYKKGGGK